MIGDCLKLGECFIVETDAGFVGQLGDLETEPYGTERMAIDSLLTRTEILRVQLSRICGGKAAE